MTIDDMAAYKRRTTDAFLRVALQTALIRIGEMSGNRADETLRQFERAFDLGLRTLPAPAGSEFMTMAAAEDAYCILCQCVQHARVKLHARAKPTLAAA